MKGHTTNLRLSAFSIAQHRVKRPLIAQHSVKRPLIAQHSVKRPLAIALLGFSGLAVAAGCGGSLGKIQNSQSTTPQAAMVRARVVDDLIGLGANVNVSSSETSRVYTGANLLSSLTVSASNLPFGGATDYVSIDPGTYAFTLIKHAMDTTNLISGASSSQTLAPGGTYTLVAVGDSASGRTIQPILDTPPTSAQLPVDSGGDVTLSRSALRIVHMSPDAPAVDLYSSASPLAPLAVATPTPTPTATPSGTTTTTTSAETRKMTQAVVVTRAGRPRHFAETRDVATASPLISANNITYGNASPYIYLQSGSASIAVYSHTATTSATTSAATTPLLSLGTVYLVPGEAYTLFIVGKANPGVGEEALTAVLVADNAAPVL